MVLLALEPHPILPPTIIVKAKCSGDCKGGVMQEFVLALISFGASLALPFLRVNLKTLFLFCRQLK